MSTHSNSVQSALILWNAHWGLTPTQKQAVRKIKGHIMEKNSAEKQSFFLLLCGEVLYIWNSE